MKNEAPDCTIHAIKGYAKLIKPKTMKKICKAAIMFQKLLGLHKSTKLTYIDLMAILIHPQVTSLLPKLLG